MEGSGLSGNGFILFQVASLTAYRRGASEQPRTIRLYISRVVAASRLWQCMDDDLLGTINLDFTIYVICHPLSSIVFLPTFLSMLKTAIKDAKFVFISGKGTRREF